MKDSSPPGLGTVRNAARVLAMLAEPPGLHHLTDLASKSGISIPTLHRLSRSLVYAGLAVQDPTTLRYGLGPEIVRLSSHMRSDLPIVKALSPFAVALRDQLGATITTSILTAGENVAIDQVDASDRGPFRRPAGFRPALLSAAGRLLAARADDHQWDLAVEQVQHAPEVVKEAGAKRAEWAESEYLVYEDLTSFAGSEIAVPIVGAGGTVHAGLTADLAVGADKQRIEFTASVLQRTAASAAGGLRND